jgi:hypothetical protein
VIITGPLLFNEEELFMRMAVTPEVWGTTWYILGKLYTENKLITLLKNVRGQLFNLMHL